jgi:predicted RNA-binding Zn-ribbon protein involved in translation (DUF1610 family)
MRFAKMLSAPPVPCPHCGERVTWRYTGSFFDCPSCGATLRVRSGSFAAAFGIGVLLAYGVAYLGGVTVGAFGTLVLVAIPFFVLVLLVATRLFTPEIDIVSTRTSVLHLADRTSASVVAGAAPATERPVQVGRQMFQVRRQPFSLETALVALTLLGLFGWRFYDSLEPAIYAVMPGYRAVREGGPGFPATIRIGETSLQISNGSEEPWNCGLALGRSGRYRARVGVHAGGTGEVPYDAFAAPQASRSGETLHSEARNVIRMECVEPGGRRHSWYFD